MRSLTVAIIAAASLAAGAVSADLYRQLYPERIIEHIHDNKAGIVREVEERFGIKFKNVNVRYVNDIPKRGGNITIMNYDPGADTVNVSRVGASLLTPASATGTFVHELGHDYTYQVVEELSGAGQLHESYKFQNRRLDLDDPLINLIVEGIGQYFPIRFGLRSIPEYAWPNSINGILDIYLYPYHYGHRFVGPILDKAGVEIGLREIFSNAAPSLEEMINPGLFHRRILSSSP